MTPQQLKESIEALKKKTNYPFSVNLVNAPPEERSKDLMDVEKIFNEFRHNLDLPQRSHADIELPKSHLEEQLQIIL